MNEKDQERYSHAVKHKVKDRSKFKRSKKVKGTHTLLNIEQGTGQDMKGNKQKQGTHKLLSVE
jgi:hypothetical protein